MRYLLILALTLMTSNAYASPDWFSLCQKALSERYGETIFKTYNKQANKATFKGLEDDYTCGLEKGKICIYASTGLTGGRGRDIIWDGIGGIKCLPLDSKQWAKEKTFLQEVFSKDNKEGQKAEKEFSKKLDQCYSKAAKIEGFRITNDKQVNLKAPTSNINGYGYARAGREIGRVERWSTVGILPIPVPVDYIIYCTTKSNVGDIVLEGTSFISFRGWAGDGIEKEVQNANQ